MSKVLEYFRSKDPRLADVPDEDLALYVADRHPEFLEDEEFSGQIYKLTGPTDARSSLSPVEVTAPQPPSVDEGDPLPPVNRSATPPRGKLDRDTDAAAKLWQFGQPAPKLSTAEANALNTWYEAGKEMAGENLALKAQLERQRQEQMREIGVEPVLDVPNPIQTVGKPIGEGVYRGAKVAQAAIGDVASLAAGVPAENLQSFADNPDAALPIQEQVRDADHWAQRAVGYLGLSLAAAPVYLGATAALGQAGLPPVPATAAVLGFDKDGRPDPVGIAAAFGLPIVDAAGRKLASKALEKIFDQVKVVRTEITGQPGKFAVEILNRGLLKGLDRDAIVKGIEIGGGQLADNAYLMALQTPGILTAEDPKEALMEAVSSNLAMALSGAPELKAGGKSITYEALRKRFERGEWPQVTTRPAAEPKSYALPEPAVPPPGPAPAPATPPSPPPAPAPAPTPAPAPAAPAPAAPAPAAAPVPVPRAPTPPAPEAARPAEPAARPSPTDPDVTLGRPTVVRGSNESQFPAMYAWVPASKIHGSHLPGFATNPAYAPLVNTRRYDKDLAEQEKVVRGAATFDASSYVSNGRSAADGPIMVSQGHDGRYRVLGGNGRWQMIQSLTADQAAELGKVADEEAPAFGLPVRPTPDAILVRLFPPTDLANAESLAGAKRVVDLLNPSPGLLETAASMARNDAPKVSLEALTQMSGDLTPAEAKAWIRSEITANRLDRSTRGQIMASDNQAIDFAERVRLHAAYGDDQVVELARSAKTSETMRVMITSPLPTLLALRGAKEPLLAGALIDMINQVSGYQAEGMKLPTALRWLNEQQELIVTPESKLARNLALSLGSQIVLLQPNRRGERKVDFDDTKENFERFWSGLSRSIQASKGEPDLNGQTRSMPEVIADFIRLTMGDNPRLIQEPNGFTRVEANSDVARLNKLTDQARTRKLTAKEDAERAAIEARLGQGFMTFWTEKQGQMQSVDPKLKRLEMEAKAKSKLVGSDITTQTDMFSPPSEEGGQLTLMDRKRRYKPDERQITFSFEAVPVGAIQGVSGRESDVPGSGRSPDWVARIPRVQGFHLAAAQVKAELIQAGKISIIGRRVSGHGEMAALLQVLRSPQVEVFHWIFVRSGVVVGRHSIGVRLPDETRTFGPADNSETLRSQMLALGADGYYIAHNHPSGTVIPSPADKIATREIVARVPGFLGHIVTDHLKYALIYEDGYHEYFELRDGVAQRASNGEPSELYDPLLAATPPEWGGIIGRLLPGPEEVLGWQWELRRHMKEGVVQIMLLSTDARVRAVLDVDAGTLDSRTFQSDLREFAVSQGAIVAYAMYLGADRRTTNRIKELVRLGSFFDGFLAYGQPEGEFSSVALDNGINPPPLQGKYYMGFPRPDRAGSFILRAMRDTDITYEFAYGPLDNRTGKRPTVPMKLGHWDKIRPAEMPEMVRLARELLGHVPTIRNLPGIRGVFSQAGLAPTIKLSPGIFVDPIRAAGTLAHEIGHLIDFLPEGTLARGNMFGRLASLRDFLAHTFPIESTTPISSILTPKDRARIRSQAERKVGPKPPADEEADRAAWLEEVRREYAEMIAEEIEARGLTTLEVIRGEFWALSQEWRPLPPGEIPPAHLAYRTSGVEMYADFLSVILNSPGLAEELAPTVYQMFWDYLDRKPQVKDELFSLQDWLQSGKVPILTRREGDILGMFAKGEMKMRAAADARELRRTSWKGFWTQLGNDLIDRNFAARAKAQSAGDDFTVGILDALGMRDNANMELIRNVYETVIKPSEDMGVPLGLLGEVLFLERIVAGDRAILANPLGHTPLTARAQLWKLRHDIGLGRWTEVKRLVKKFHDGVFQVVERAVETGVYNRETFDTVIAPNRDTYAAFAVVDYLEDFVPPSIRQQMGTFNDVANPMVATLLKTVGLQNLIAWNVAKTTVRDMLQRSFPAEIRPADVVGPHDARRAKTHPDHGILSPLVNGRPEHWYIDPYIAQAFEEVPPMHLASLVRVLDTAFRKVLYPLIITYNPGFLFVTSPIREVRRTGRNLPVNWGKTKLVLEYARVWKEVAGRYQGVSGSLTREMEATMALATPFDVIGSAHRDDALGRLMERYQLLPEAKKGWFWTANIMKWPRTLAQAIERWGMVVDALPKYAAYNIMKREGGFKNAKETGAWVRTYAGLPNIKNRGRSLNMVRAFVPFWNVVAQGWRADRRLMTQPTTRGGYWMRWMLSEGWLTILQALGASGLLGLALKSLFDGVSEYRKTNQTVLPIGTIAGGDFGLKTVALTMPRDETDRLISGMVYKIITSLAGGKPSTTTMQDLGDLVSFGGGQLPGVNSVLTIADRWADYSRNIPPLDPLTGRPIIPNRQWNAGGVDSLAPMASWTLEQGRLNIWSHNTRANTTTEMALNAAPILSRFVTITDYGHREKQRAMEQAGIKRDAQRVLSYDIEVQKLIGEYNALRGLAPGNRTPIQEQRLQELSPWYHTTYRPLDEQIEESMAGRDGAGVVQLRRQLNRSVSEVRPRR